MDVPLERVLSIIRDCELTTTEGMTNQVAAVFMKQIILSAVRSVFTENPQIELPINSPGYDAGCRRGDKFADEYGAPFPHQYDPGTKVCVFCGDGAIQPPPAAYETKPTGNRTETIPCNIHGSHSLIVRPDGSYDKPGCEMFG